MTGLHAPYLEVGSGYGACRTAAMSTACTGAGVRVVTSVVIAVTLATVPRGNCSSTRLSRDLNESRGPLKSHRLLVVQHPCRWKDRRHFCGCLRVRIEIREECGVDLVVWVRVD